MSFTPPDQYHGIHILSLGAGVQSSTIALMAAAGEITPMPTAAIFADTQAEPASVYRWLNWLEKQLPFPVYKITKGSLIEAATTVKQKRDGSGWYATSAIPAFVKNPDGSEGTIKRQCTRDFKIDPIRKKVREIARKQIIEWHCELLRLGYRRRDFRKANVPRPVIQWIGISLDEVYRMKPSRENWQENRWPLIELRMKRHDCLRWMESRGYPKPPRSSCIVCPYHSDAEWRRLRDEEPEEFSRASVIEKEFQAAKARGGLHGQLFLHRSLVPLEQVDLSTDADRGQGDLWGNECEGICGV